MLHDHIDRSAIKQTSFEEAEAEGIVFWLNKNAERIAAMEELRKLIHGHVESTPEFQEFLQLMNSKQIESILVGGTPLVSTAIIDIPKILICSSPST
jgi:hypothetical protein